MGKASGASAGIPMSEVKKHTTKASAWVALYDQIYDLTQSLEDHIYIYIYVYVCIYMYIYIYMTSC